jgi:hypothetical protein
MHDVNFRSVYLILFLTGFKLCLQRIMYLGKPAVVADGARSSACPEGLTSFPACSE